MAKAQKVILLTGLLVLGACKKDEVVEVDLGYGYFPTAVGTWVEYQVDSLWRDDPSDVLDSVSYRLKQRIEELYQSADCGTSVCSPQTCGLLGGRSQYQS